MNEICKECGRREDERTKTEKNADAIRDLVMTIVLFCLCLVIPLIIY